MKTPFSLTIDQPLFDKLSAHLFPGDGDEHGAVIAAGVCESSRGTRFLAREVFLARDGVDYVPGKRGYRALTAEFVARTSDFCSSRNLCYFAVHPHGGFDSVSFSRDDLDSHERGYPALLDITSGGPVGALVFSKNAVAGDIWTPNGRFALDHMKIVGARMRQLYPSPPQRSAYSRPMYDRHARIFGDMGQAVLANLKIGIIGLGGGGSLISEWLSRLGVGHIIAIDFDKANITNVPRIPGATQKDVFLTGSKHKILRGVGNLIATPKVRIAKRVARAANPQIRFEAIDGDILDEATARLLTDADFIFLASDTFQCRAVFNALVHQYIIPGAQVGVKIPVNKNTGEVGDIFTASRVVLPHSNGGCLYCHELIPPARLQEEALTELERKAQRYVEHDEVIAPSVITLNVLSAGPVVNDFLMMFTRLYEETVALGHQMNFVRCREVNNVGFRFDETCLYCSNHKMSRRAYGDRKRLPCRMPNND